MNKVLFVNATIVFFSETFFLVSAMLNVPNVDDGRNHFQLVGMRHKIM